MRIKVNGQEKTLPDHATTLNLLKEVQLAPEKVAIELNKRLLRSARYNEPLKEGDKLEIVTFVGGG